MPALVVVALWPSTPVRASEPVCQIDEWQPWAKQVVDPDAGAVHVRFSGEEIVPLMWGMNVRPMRCESPCRVAKRRVSDHAPFPDLVATARCVRVVEVTPGISTCTSCLLAPSPSDLWFAGVSGCASTRVVDTASRLLERTEYPFAANSSTVVRTRRDRTTHVTSLAGALTWIRPWPRDRLNRSHAPSTSDESRIDE